MMKKILLMLIILFTPLFAVPASVGAVNVFGEDVCDRAQAKQSTVCKDQNINNDKGDQKNPLFGKRGIITTIINILSVIVAIVSVISIIAAGLKFITSGSNPQDVSKAREQIIYACVGLVIAGSAQVIVKFVLNNIVEGS